MTTVGDALTVQLGYFDHALGQKDQIWITLWVSGLFGSVGYLGQ